MAQTDIDRAGTFNTSKLGVLESRLRSISQPVQVYGTDTGLRATWPNGLTAPQVTTATSIINAYVEATDLSSLSPLQVQAFQFLSNSSPTNAQTLAALKGVIKYLLQMSTGKINIDGTSIE